MHAPACGRGAHVEPRGRTPCARRTATCTAARRYSRACCSRRRPTGASWPPGRRSSRTSCARRARLLAPPLPCPSAVCSLCGSASCPGVLALWQRRCARGVQGRSLASGPGAGQSCSFACGRQSSTGWRAAGAPLQGRRALARRARPCAGAPERGARSAARRRRAPAHVRAATARGRRCPDARGRAAPRRARSARRWRSRPACWRSTGRTTRARRTGTRPR